MLTRYALAEHSPKTIIMFRQGARAHVFCRLTVNTTRFCCYQLMILDREKLTESVFKIRYFVFINFIKLIRLRIELSLFLNFKLYLKTFLLCLNVVTNILRVYKVYPVTFILKSCFIYTHIVACKRNLCASTEAIETSVKIFVICQAVIRQATNESVFK